MSRRWVVAMGIVTAALAAYIFFVERHRVSTRDVEGRSQRVLETFLRDRVTRIEIERHHTKTVLTKQGDASGESDLGTWRLEAPVPAAVDEEAFTALVDALEWLDARRVLFDVSAEDRRRFGVDRPRIRASFRVAAERVVISLGGEDPRGEGVYAALAGKPHVYIVGKDFFETLDHDADHFRDKRLVVEGALEGIDRVEVRAPATLRVERRDGAWWIAGAAPVLARETGVLDAVRAIGALRAERFVSERAHELARYGLEPAVHELSFSREDAERVRVRLGTPCEQDATTIHALIGERGPIVCARGRDEVVRAVSLTAAGVREVRLVPLADEQVERLTLRDGARACFDLERGDGGWRANVPGEAFTPDEDAIAEFTRRLREATIDLAAAIPPLQGPTMSLEVKRLEAGTLTLRARVRDGRVDVARDGEREAFTVASEAAELFACSAVRFRPRALWQLTAQSVARLERRRDGATEVFVREASTWRRDSPAGAVDSSAIGELARRLSSLTAVRFVPGVTREAAGLATPRATWTVQGTDASGEAASKVLRVGAATDGGAFAEVDGGPGIFVLAPSVADVAVAELASAP